MTINYNLSVSTSKPWTLFKLLFKWKGSVYKSICVELIVWLILYYIINFIYRFALTEAGQIRFESAISYCDDGMNFIPLSFMLSFFVSTILSRWLTLYANIGFIDNVALKTSLYIRGKSEEATLYRRTIVRYACCVQIMYFRDISMRVRQRFPTLDAVVEAGFLLPEEKEIFEGQKLKASKNWMFMQWAFHLVYEARAKGYIESDYYQLQLNEDLNVFRKSLAQLAIYDMVPIPQVYPQLVCMAVHTYFLLSLMARQFVIPEHATAKKQVDIYFPITGVLQFVFYMGWMKIAEVMLNPFGEDDDDFETNRIIDRNIAIALEIVDTAFDLRPPMVKDAMYNEKTTPMYAVNTKIPDNDLRESVSHVVLPPSRMKYVPLEQENTSSEPSRFRKSIRTKISSFTNILSNKGEREPRKGSLPCPSTITVETRDRIIEPRKLSSSASEGNISGRQDSFLQVPGHDVSTHEYPYNKFKQSLNDLRKGANNLKEHPLFTVSVNEEDETGSTSSKNENLVE